MDHRCQEYSPVPEDPSWGPNRCRTQPIAVYSFERRAGRLPGTIARPRCRHSSDPAGRVFLGPALGVSVLFLRAPIRVTFPVDSLRSSSVSFPQLLHVSAALPLPFEDVGPSPPPIRAGSKRDLPPTTITPHHRQRQSPCNRVPLSRSFLHSEARGRGSDVILRQCRHRAANRPEPAVFGMVELDSRGAVHTAARNNRDRWPTGGSAWRESVSPPAITSSEVQNTRERMPGHLGLPRGRRNVRGRALVCRAPLRRQARLEHAEDTVRVDLAPWQRTVLRCSA